VGQRKGRLGTAQSLNLDVRSIAVVSVADDPGVPTLER
jgi:hypothetical protein